LTDTENSVRNVEDFIDEYDITFDVLSDPDSSIGTKYEAQALPKSYLINTKGEIHNIAVGPLNYEQMMQAFDEMDECLVINLAALLYSTVQEDENDRRSRY